MAAPGPQQLIGASASLRMLSEQIRRIAPSEVSVLLSGETGTGKELAARSIHHQSARRAGPFIPVECGAVPESLFDGELFGHRRGAFTGADADRVGRVLAAHGGTLFLDGIDHLSMPCQARLLRVLQEKEVLPLGETRAQRADFRLITSVSPEFPERLRGRQFRQDLYFRINVVQLRLPPLRERQDDIAVLAEIFLQDLARRFGKSIHRLDGAARRALEEYGWPGNVRELQGVLECAVAGARGDILREADLPVYVRMRRSPELSVDPPTPPASAEEQEPETAPTFLQQVERFQRNLILDALQRNAWDYPACLRELGLSRHQLKYLCAKLGIRRGRFELEL